ncbi:hypothetical protein [Aquimarina sp. MMG016]|uniref:hypothetical protein n=1 Tax=Aquimarina sp. MMG016 TaxID=2822690 RepID=UPI001B3A5D94|nr:hypothetical protein [Aquimarina sp. MMG016]
MKTHFTITKGKKKGLKLLLTKVLSKWASNYIRSMSKALFPPGSEEVQPKNDKHRILHK